jgi:hypothetical protein
LPHQFIGAAFRSQQSPLGSPSIVNLNDPASSSVAWSSGATVIEQIAVQPPLGEIWSVLGWAITMRAFMLTGSNAYGKLGRIVGGIVHMQPTPTDPAKNGGAWVNPQLAFPNNSTGLNVIWDGQTDPALRSIYSPYPSSTELQGELMLPVPIELYPGDDIQIGLWITPSLAQNVQIAVAYANYTVTFDDNRAPTTPW